MFEFLLKEGHEKGSEERYRNRIKVFETNGTPVLIHHWWWIVHNCVAHPLIGFFPFKRFFDFHDWTSQKINAELE